MPIRFSASRIPARILPFRSSRSTSTRAFASIPGYASVDGSSMAAGARNRCPKVVRPEVTLPNENGRTSSPYSETIQWTGRANRTSRSAHRIDFLNGIAGRKSETIFGRISWTGRRRLLANEAEVVAAIGRKDGEGRDVDPLGLRESEGRLRRLAGGVQSHAFRRAHHGLFRRRLPVLEVPDHVRQPPRGTVDVDLPEGEAGLLQHPLELLASEPERGADESRRDFLAADLEQIVTFHRNPSSRVVSLRLNRRTSPSSGKPISSRDRRNPSAQKRARFRTRPM